MKTSRKIHKEIVCMSFQGFGYLLVLTLTLFTLSCTKPPQVVKTAPPEPEVARPLEPEPEPTELERWQNLIIQNKYASIDKKLASVNEFFNRFDFIEDKYLWGVQDYWATVYETLKKGGGDCEDFTIAKYFTFRELNIPDENMRITYVISLKSKKPHMVLTLRKDASQEPIVLDTLNNYLFPISRRPDLVPVYSFNREGYWLVKNQKGWKNKRLGSAKKLSQWQGVLQRTRQSEAVYSGG